MTAQPMIHRVTDHSSRVEVAEALAAANHRAKRCTPKVGTPALPTAWDVAHDLIDALLEDWEQSR